MAVSTMAGTAKKKKKAHGIWHFGLSRSTGNKFARQFCEVVNVMNFVYFYKNFFRFTKKFLPLLTL